MDNDSSTMQNDTQQKRRQDGSGKVNASDAAQSKETKVIRAPSKLVENAFFCYSLPDSFSPEETPENPSSIEDALKIFPRSYESFLRAASSLPLKLRGWWKTPCVLAWQWLEEPSPTAAATFSVIVGFDNSGDGFASRAPDWLASPKTRDQFRRIIHEGFRRLFPSIFQNVKEVEMQMAEWYQKRAENFVKLHQISVPGGKAAEYSELFALVERDVGLISPQYHRGHLEKPSTKPGKVKKDLLKSPSKRSAADGGDDASPSKKSKTQETDPNISKAAPVFAKPAIPVRVQQRLAANPSSPTKQSKPPKPSPGQSSGLPAIVRKKDISPPAIRKANPNPGSL